MLTFRNLSHFLFMIIMLVLLFSLPLQHAAATVPGAPAGSALEQFLVSTKPETSVVGTRTVKDISKVQKKANAPAEDPNIKPDSPEMTHNLNDTTTVRNMVYSLTEGVSCYGLGMIPDDDTKGLYNYNILIDEVKKGTKIHVNGTYYLESPYSECGIENETDMGLFLTGDSPANSKLILKGGSFFNIKGSAIIENIFIECPTNRVSHLIRMTAPFVNEITIRNNYITGNIRLVDSDTPLDFDFASTPCSVKIIVIEDNEFYDVYNSSGARYIIRLIDTPVKLSFIKNNKVTNFSYIFYINGITNGHPFRDYLIENNNAVIENNTVICTDDYDAVTKNKDQNSRYYCFALIEGFRVECMGNIFDGFHLSDAPNTGVYDNYFSVTKLLYENNTWKNLVNFTQDFEKTYLMMSKIAINVAGEKTERIYRNNTYIVEPGYADRFGKDRFLLKKDLNIYQVDIDCITIEDNYFDMYILRFNHTNQRFKELYKFNRNTVLMHTIDKSKYAQTFAYIDQKKDESGEYITRDLIFTNNTITCENEPFGQAIGTLEFCLIYNNAGRGDKTTVDFSNNYIDVPGLGFIHANNRTYSDIIATVNYNNNTIKGIETQSDLAKQPSNQIY